MRVLDVIIPVIVLSDIKIQKWDGFYQKKKI